jgi:hypothetical protein
MIHVAGFTIGPRYILSAISLIEFAVKNEDTDCIKPIAFLCPPTFLHYARQTDPLNFSVQIEGKNIRHP